MSKKSRPTISLTPGNIEQIEKHAEKADREPTIATPQSNYPWDNSELREDVKKLFNLRLSEVYLTKLQWLAEKEDRSMHKLLIRVVEQYIDDAVAQQISRE